MTGGKLICVLLLLCAPASPAERRPTPEPPNKFEIGRHTFFDNGPQHHFYELFVVRSNGNGTLIERMILTPAVPTWSVPAKVEDASATVGESVPALLGSKNPCAIPERDLQRELKRHKKQLVFSFANVVMRFPCGTQTRLIRADILDRDMFDPAAKTPEETSWTMQLLQRLDRAVGPGVMDKPVFPSPGKEELAAKDIDPETLSHLRAGDYDALFPGDPDKPSELYRAAQHRPPID